MASKDGILIDASEVGSVAVIECGEPLVPVQVATLDHPSVRNRTETKFLCRASVATRLNEADRLLPDGYNLAVVEAHRSLDLQAEYWNDCLGVLRAENPKWDSGQIEREAAQFVARPFQAPHSTGGAVDVILLNAASEPVDMGSELNVAVPEMVTSALVAETARKHRELLVAAMETAGFVNYFYEWWHFSYGDRYWACLSGAPAAIYCSQP